MKKIIVFDAPSETQREARMSTNGFIRLDSLQKSFQEGEHTRRVLAGASAQFRQGEFAAIVGKSGSGKSTLLNLISGIDRPDRGAEIATAILAG